MTVAPRPGRLAGPAPVFEALGDATRLDLLSRLCEEGPQSITRLTAGTDISRQGVTKHLHILEEAGLLRGARRGRERIWEVEARQLEVARRFLEQASRRWDVALGRLKALVEEEPG